MAPVTPAQIDEEIDKHLALVADLRAQKNSYFPIFRQLREVAATKRTVAPCEESLAESSGSFKMSVLLEPLDESDPKKAPGEDAVKSGSPKEWPMVARPDTRISGKRKRPAGPGPEDEEEEDPNMIDHDPPCDQCAKAEKPCRGMLDRPCSRCIKQKVRCNRFGGGRGGRGSGGPVKAFLDTKGKARVRASPWDMPPSRKTQVATSSNSAQESAETSLDLTTIDDDNKTPQRRTEAASPTNPPCNIIADMNRAILALESKILTGRGYLKDLQARVSTTENLVMTMESDLDRVKSLVEKLGN